MTRILVASRDESVWATFNTIVSPEAHETYAADSVADAARPEVAECFDMVLLDVESPDIGILQSAIDLRLARSPVRLLLLVKGLSELAFVNFRQAASGIPGIDVITRRGLASVLQTLVRTDDHLMLAA